jgi:thioredoxin reductase
MLGIKLSLALVGLGKEVRIIGANFDFLGEKKERVINFLQEKGITLHLESSIQEAVGEGMIKAVKISPLKVFSSQLVFVDSGFSPNLGFFEDEIISRDTFFTNHEDVYLLGDVTQSDIETKVLFSNNYQEAREQAALLCDYILDEKAPVFQRKVEDAQDIDKEIDVILSENKVVENI